MNNQTINQLFRAGGYIRLSIEDEVNENDEKTNKYHRDESESITNQRSLLLQYASEHGIDLVDFYIDDGYTGTNFNRPGFKKMIRDIENGKINMVITKDLSRFGRDYIETGEYIEKWFPAHGIRFIAVTDNVDTFKDGTNNDLTPFKALMNDFYARDTSKKVKSSLKAKMKAGKWVGGRPPFGYDVDPLDKNHLVVNKEQAQVVRRIYDMALQGISCYRIADTLTNEKVKSPAQYYEFIWKKNYNINYGLWHGRTIQNILQNQLYTGDLVQNRRSKVNYKVKKVVRNDPSEYIIVPDKHEPIVSKEEFERVQQLLPKAVGRSTKKESHLFDGLLYCHECGHRISVTARKKTNNLCYTLCNHYRSFRKFKACTPHTNNYDKLELAILNNIKKQCQLYLDEEKVKNDLNYKSFDPAEEIKHQQRLLSMEINNLKLKLDDIYIDKLNGVIDTSQYLRIKLKIEEDINQKEQKFNDLANNNNAKRLKKSKRTIEKYINEFLSFNNPSRELIINLIERIEIYEDKTIDVKLTFKNS